MTKNLQPENFELQTNTVWSFPDRGTWATHNPKFRGNWAPQIPRNLIERYTKPGDTVLDQMCGYGTTLIECKLTGRHAFGFDINPKMVESSRKNLNFGSDGKIGKVDIEVAVGDARNLEGKIENDSIDFIATHPPYLDIIKYSDGEIEGDLSNIHNVEKFCIEMKRVASECYRVMRSNKYCAILIGDTRRRRYYIPLAYKVMEIFINSSFKLKEDIIKVQWNCKTTPFWTKKSKDYNFLLIMHEHLFVFEKINQTLVK